MLKHFFLKRAKDPICTYENKKKPRYSWARTHTLTVYFPPCTTKIPSASRFGKKIVLSPLFKVSCPSFWQVKEPLILAGPHNYSLPPLLKKKKK